jgi:hypothetical protein
MPQVESGNSQPPASRSVDMNGLFSNAMVREVSECIARMVPDWSFDVRPHGLYGSGIIIRIRLWKGNHTEEIDVNPFHYINHRDPWTRENPTLAAVTDGISKFLEASPPQETLRSTVGKNVDAR